MSTESATSPWAPLLLRVTLIGAVALASCADDPASDGPAAPSEPSDTAPTAPTAAPELVMLSPTEQAARISLSLRGHRPSPEELDLVVADPDALYTLVDTWLQSDGFARTIRDMHAEQLLLRNDLLDPFPSNGLLEGIPTWEVYQSVTEEPLKLVEHVVTNDLGYDSILTLDHMLTDRLVARVFGLPFDEAGPEWQEARWSDGRPMAGLLSSSGLWNRYRSGPVNHQRRRAAFVSDKLLCDPISERDVVVPTDLDFADWDAVNEAIWYDPGCVACHQSLDPLGAFFWGFRGQIRAAEVLEAYDAGCMGMAVPFSFDAPPEPLRDLCYPLRMYQPEKEDRWAELDLRPPGYYGQPAERLDDLGALVAADPRFASCTARRFWSWFAHVDRDDVDHELVVELTEILQESDFDAKALTRAVVLHPRFLASHLDGESADTTYQPVGVLRMRPEQYQDSILELTGFTWWATAPEPDCGTLCWRWADLGRSDKWGFRALGGGVDSSFVLNPSYETLPTGALLEQRAAAEAAGWVVQRDFERPAAERRLLALVEPGTVDEAAIRAQLADLHARIGAEPVAPDSPEVDASYALWSQAHGLHGDPARAWSLTLAALLQDARMVFY